MNGTIYRELDLARRILNARFSGLLRLRPAPNNIYLDCLKEKCPRNCCSNLEGAFVSESEAAPLIRLQALKKSDNGYELRSCNGECVLLKSGLCSAYESRPQSCKDYPWYNIGGKLFIDRGCPGLQLGKDGRPSTETLQPSSHYFGRFWVWLLTHW
jgi:Fe-S-cluster containining protein